MADPTNAEKLDEIASRLARVEAMVRILMRASAVETERDEMAQADIDKLRATVAKNTSVTQGAAALVRGLAQQLRDNADDPDEINALADQLSADADALAAAVAENTSSGGAGGGGGGGGGEAGGGGAEPTGPGPAGGGSQRRTGR